MFSGHFYHATLRKTIAAFGTLFNNISVVRRDANGAVINIQRVPLAYGPKQKFLARIDEQPNLDAAKVAIKLPRMSYELTTMVYDASIKTNRNNLISVVDPLDPMHRTTVGAYVPFRLGIQLSIMAKNQDDALQIVEQILPYFQPEYTITIKDVEGLDIPNDIPIVLTSTQITEEYEGDFVTRRAIIYTLDFEARVRFYPGTGSRSITKKVIASLLDSDSHQMMEQIKVAIDPLTAKETDVYTILETITPYMNTSSFKLTVGTGTGSFVAGQTITGSITGTTGKVTSFDAGIVTVHDADGPFQNGETVTATGVSRPVTKVVAVY
jgi:hypothetical protein